MSAREEALDWLFSTQRFGIKLGLENMRRLLTELGEPHIHLSFIHVAGTNGKGSVCAMIDAILRAEGLNTGLFTSPHLVDFRERIQINGDPINDAALADGIRILRKIAMDWGQDGSPTFFELSAALAIQHFSQSAVDYAILETGMGGRLDATNVIRPRVSVITPIARDHEKWLGNSLEEIAAEKAGILKQGIPAVSATQRCEVEKVLKSIAEKVGTSIRFTRSGVSSDVNVSLPGAFQRENASLAISAIRTAGIAVRESSIREGLANTHWPGRFQRLGKFILDAAHNPHSAEKLVETWKSTFGSERPCIMFGALEDKAISEMLGWLDQITGKYWFVPVANERACPTGRLRELRPEGIAFDSVDDALTASTRNPGPILVCGSIYLLGEVIKEVTRRGV